MTLSSLIEADMTAFLDIAAKPMEKRDVPRQEDASIMVQNRDWHADIKALLKKGDLDGAKKVFNELKQRYNETPDDHPVEKRKLYELIQSCYVTIVNHVQDRAKTQALIRQMEQLGGDVFNRDQRPVSLAGGEVQKVIEVIEQVQPPPAPASARASRQPVPAPPTINVTVVAPTPTQPPPAPASKFDPPGMPDPFAQLVDMPAPPGGVKPDAAQNMQRPRVDDDLKGTELVSGIQRGVQRALGLTKTDPAEATRLTAKARHDIERAIAEGALSLITSRSLLEQIEMIESELGEAEARLTFAQLFTDAYAKLGAKLRVKDPASLSLYTDLSTKARAFEQLHPTFSGQFSGKLDELARQYRIMDEDAIVEVLRPILLRLRDARRRKDPHAFMESVHALSTFTATLPKGEERELLEAAVNRIGRKA